MNWVTERRGRRHRPQPARDSGGELFGQVDPRVLQALVDTAADGLAILDEQRRYVYVNPAGCRLLAAPLEQLVGTVAVPFALVMGGGADPVQTAIPHWSVVPGPRGSRRIEVDQAPVTTTGGVFRAVAFRDVTEIQRQERELSGFARTASSLAYAVSLDAVLDEVAAGVWNAIGIAACTVLVLDSPSDPFDLIGTAGGYPDDWPSRLERCRAAGADLTEMRALRSGTPVIASAWASSALADERWNALHDVLRARDWSAQVAVPLSLRDQVIGVLTACYPGDEEPDRSDVAFLGAMADLAAVAIENHRLLAELEEKAALEERHRIARDLHDAVSQALFSITLHARAVQLANEQDGPDRREQVDRGLATLRDLTRGVLAEMRALIFQLRPDALREEGLTSAVRKHAGAVAAKQDLIVTIDAPEDRLPLDVTVEQHLFRVVQEALSNVVKHASARTVRITIRPCGEQNRALEIIIADDGVGFDAHGDYPGHLGLATMRERTDEIGGVLTVTSARGEATTVRVWVADAGEQHSSGARRHRT